MNTYLITTSDHSEPIERQASSPIHAVAKLLALSKANEKLDLIQDSANKFRIVSPNGIIYAVKQTTGVERQPSKFDKALAKLDTLSQVELNQLCQTLVSS